MTKHWGDLVQEKTRQYGELCVGIDPVIDDIPDIFKQAASMPADALLGYINFVLDTVADKVGYVKFQSAFYEAFGSKGVEVMASGFAKARSKGLGIILDAKRGDIGSTATAYSKAYLTPNSLSDLEVDCITVNPFLGPETVEPFVECARKYGKGVFVLAKTSNPGAGWLQDQLINDEKVSNRVAGLVAQWAEQTVGESGLSAVGAVVGITFPDDAKRLRTVMPNSVFLAPGFGPQGGKLEDVIALRRSDNQGVVVPVSRGVTMPNSPSISLESYEELMSERILNFKNALRQTNAAVLGNGLDSDPKPT